MREMAKDLFFSSLSLFYPGELSSLVDRIKNGVFSAKIRRKAHSTGKVFSVAHGSTLTGLERVDFGENFHAYSRLRLEAISRYKECTFEPHIHIGNDVIIQFDCHIAAINDIEIGDGVLIASKVVIIDHCHGFVDERDIDMRPADRPLSSKGPIRIGRNVWIGEGAAILPGVSIGANAIIGANAVVTRDIPENAVAAGAPARVVKLLGNARKR